MTGSAPDIPLYEEMQDTPWITRNRQLNENVYPYLTNAYENLGSFDQDYMQSLADDYSGSQWSDLNRNYQNTVNRNLARNYGRMGTYNDTTSAYSDETINRYYNDLASRVASNTAQYYDQLVGNNLSRQLDQLKQYQNLFDTSGQTTQNQDLMNQQIRWTNQDRAWQNDVRDFNNSFGQRTLKAIPEIIKGASVGAMTGGPWGAVAGGIGGLASGYLGSSQDTDTYKALGSLANTNKGSSGLSGSLGSLLGSSGGSSSGFNPSFSGFTSLFG